MSSEHFSNISFVVLQNGLFDSQFLQTQRQNSFALQKANYTMTKNQIPIYRKIVGVTTINKSYINNNQFPETQNGMKSKFNSTFDLKGHLQIIRRMEAQLQDISKIKRLKKAN